jgi:hypothetical protein
VRCCGERVGEVVVEATREQREESIGKKPGPGLARADEQHRADGRQQRPEADATGRDETADAPLRDERRKQEQRKLDQPEDIEVERFQVNQQIADQHQLQGKGKVGGKARSKLPVDQQPDDRGQADQPGGKKQQRLLQAQGFRVGRRDAGVAEPVEEGSVRIHRSSTHAGTRAKACSPRVRWYAACLRQDERSRWGRLRRACGIQRLSGKGLA